jgi:predicted DNA-binding transcriptional regulator
VTILRSPKLLNDGFGDIAVAGGEIGDYAFFVFRERIRELLRENVIDETGVFIAVDQLVFENDVSPMIQLAVRREFLL